MKDPSKLADERSAGAEAPTDTKSGVARGGAGQRPAAPDVGKDESWLPS